MAGGEGWARTRALGMITLSVALAGCGADARDSAPRAVPVVAATVTPDGSGAQERLVGTVRARAESALGFQVSGRIARRLVDAGTQVRKGAPLAEIDPVDLALAARAAAADVAAAEAAATQAEADEARLRGLVDGGAVSRAEYDRAKAGADSARERLAAARAAAETARNAQAYAVLRAPADGVVTAILAEQGQVVATGQPVLSFAAQGAREIAVNLPETKRRLAQESVAEVELWAEPGRSYAAKLRELSPQADPITRTYAARFTFEAPPGAFPLGATASLRLTPRTSDGRALAPLTAVLVRDGAPHVWAINAEGTRATLTPVTVAEYRRDVVAIAEGVAPGARVVAFGVNRIDEDTAIRVIAREPEGALAAAPSALRAE